MQSSNLDRPAEEIDYLVQGIHERYSAAGARSLCENRNHVLPKLLLKTAAMTHSLFELGRINPHRKEVHLRIDVAAQWLLEILLVRSPQDCGAE